MEFKLSDHKKTRNKSGKKNRSGNWKKNGTRESRYGRLAAGLMLAGILAVCAGTAWHGQQDAMQQEIAGKIIRFHVRANSDTEEDQQLKLAVRDAVGSYMQPKLAGISDIGKSRQAVEENLDGICREAGKVIASEGYTYPVTAKLTQTEFPEKTYGEYTFPAGEYEALEVEIGSGKGHNWWCVMYPNMCFFNSTYEVVEDEAEKSLERILTPKEYESLMEHKNYEVKFAFLDFLEDIKEAVAISH